MYLQSVLYLIDERSIDYFKGSLFELLASAP